ncbi:BTAD domain-containing putative transcriptional regulator [Pseudonocardia humida]|uniref:Tetratricopeptide repeat protein n=1 Tax=Pseudonocardia humida TaxID=2800819 RepID=A0ABT0ZZC0_9PSEU|nr:BTAD domain-containing putative transcriptional regulator [Pseudonocardia humida]MCO1656102.1 tetratricopeptide repeat protein [Pseudonocardia humida]
MADGSGMSGEELRARRVRGGLTQRELSRRAGLSVRAVRDIEQGRVRRPQRDSLRRLAAALGPDPTVPSTPPGSPADRLELAVLGPLAVHRAGAPAPAGPLNQRCLLGLLAVRAGQVVSLEEIIDVLWGEHPPATCRNLVHVHLSRLRRLLRTPITGVGGGYRLAVDGDRLDLLRFDELTARARAARDTDPESALDLFARALTCWRGPVLADLTARLRQHPAVVAVSQRRLAAVLAHADTAIALRRYEPAAQRLRELVHEEPLHEGAYARLVLAMAGSGQRAAALELFAELRARLVDELGVEPGIELREAQARVLRGDLPTGGPDHRSLADRAAPPPPAQLPADVAGFTGRAEQTARLDRLLPSTTAEGAGAVVVAVIAGMAGVGKTALAVHWAHRVAARFDAGQLYVDLQGHSSRSPLRPLQALAGLLRALGVPADEVPVEPAEAATLYRSLVARKRVLVVLDNAADAEQVRPLLPGSAGSVVVVTSRDRLTGLVATHGARPLPLGVLAVEDAVELIARVLGESGVTAEPAACAELARACGLLPLALRIAAANVLAGPERSITGYLAGLRSGDRLTGLAVEGDPHTAVRAAFDHSYTRLDPDGRRLLRLLSLTPGPGTSGSAAAALSGWTSARTTRLLGLLAEAHLVEPRGPGRYGLHDLLRLYARERADAEDGPAECGAALGRLLDWYLRTTDRAARLLYPGMMRLPIGPDEAGSAGAPPAGFADGAGASSWLDAERADLTAAVEHAAEHGPRPVAWLLADALRGYFWLRRDTVEWLAVARAGLAAARAAGDLRAQAAAHHSLGGAHQTLSAHDQAIEHHTSALALSERAGWSSGRATALSALGRVHWWSGGLRQSLDHHTRALALHRELDRWTGGANALLNLGLVERDLGRLRQALDHEAESLVLHRRTGARDGEAHVLSALGEIERDLGRLDRARGHLAEALALHRELGDRFGEANAVVGLAAVLGDAGHRAEALDLARAALALSVEIGNRAGEARVRNTLGGLRLRLGDPEDAADQHRRALDLARRTGSRAAEVCALLGLAACCRRLDRPAEAVEHGSAALAGAGEVGFLVLEGHARVEMAAAEHALGRVAAAADQARRAVDAHRGTGHRLGQARALRVLGCVLASPPGGGHDREAAAPHWREALALFTAVGSPEADDVRALLAP